MPTSHRVPKVASTTLLWLHTACVNAGLDFDELARSVGIDPGVLRAPDVEVPIEAAAALHKDIEAACGDPAFAVALC